MNEQLASENKYLLNNKKTIIDILSKFENNTNPLINGCNNAITSEESKTLNKEETIDGKICTEDTQLIKNAQLNLEENLIIVGNECLNYYKNNKLYMKLIKDMRTILEKSTEITFEQLQEIHERITGNRIEESHRNLFIDLRESKERDLIESLCFHQLSSINSISINDISSIFSHTLSLFLLNSTPLSLPTLSFNIFSDCIYKDNITPFLCEAVKNVSKDVEIGNLHLRGSDVKSIFECCKAEYLCLFSCAIEDCGMLKGIQNDSIQKEEGEEKYGIWMG